MAINLKKLKANLKQIRNINLLNNVVSKSNSNKLLNKKSRAQLIKLIIAVDMDEN